MNDHTAADTPPLPPAVGARLEPGVRALEPERDQAAALLLALVSDEPRCMRLLEALDKAATQENSYEYGLPLWGEPQAARLREVLYRWACGAL